MFTGWFLKRRIKKHISSIRFDLIEADPSIVKYRQCGEYQALLWLKAFVEGRTTTTPRILVKSTLAKMLIGKEESDPTNDALFALVLLPYI